MTVDLKTGMTLLEPHVCWSLLRSADVGRVAVVVAGVPDIFPINFIVDHGTIVFRTAEGTKLAAAALRSAVAFEADGIDRSSGEVWSVVVKGRAVEIARMVEVFEATDLPLYPWSSWPKPHFVRVVPDDVTGRRFQVGARTASLGATRDE